MAANINIGGYRNISENNKSILNARVIAIAFFTLNFSKNLDKKGTTIETAATIENIMPSPYFGIEKLTKRGCQPSDADSIRIAKAP